MRYIIMIFIMFFSAAGYADSIDPTQPINMRNISAMGKKKNFDGFSLQSILISSERKTAVINGQSLGEGDLFDGYTVFEIQEYQVILKREDQKKIVSFENTILKSTNIGGAP